MRFHPLSIFVVALLLGTPVAAETLTGKVVRVIDGDTLSLLVDKTEHRIRLYGIDAPESKQPFSTRAKQALSELVFGQTVTAEVAAIDFYKRKVCNVTVGDKSVSVQLVTNGAAWWYRKYAPDDQDLADAEAAAREAKRGLWASQDPVPPWEWRRRSRK